MRSVILIESDRAWARSLIDALGRRFPGLEVRWASNWAQAQRLMKSESFDLFLAASRLPDVCDGAHLKTLCGLGRLIVLCASEDEPLPVRIPQMIDSVVRDYGFEYLFTLIHRLIDNEGKHVLWLRDREDDQVGAILEDMNLTVRRISTAEQAAEALGEQDYDLVVLDEGDDRERTMRTLQAVRRHHDKLTLPVIAAARPRSQPGLLKAGANDVIGADFSPEEMLARVNNQLDLLDATRTITRQALTDPLTGLYNRNFLERILPIELAEARRYEKPLSVLMVDVDHFKRINDTFGHEGGDRALRHVADHLRAHLREADITIRYGGEEFLVIMPQTTLENAVRAADKLLLSLPEKPLALAEDAPAQMLTLSIGVATLRQDDDPDSLIRRADQALYAAKRNGRNRVEIAR